MLSDVGIGVPIMLAYVYGVVPISLCRSGGCGVSAGNGKGVRIEFDDENDNIGNGAAATGENLVLYTGKAEPPDEMLQRGITANH